MLETQALISSLSQTYIGTECLGTTILNAKKAICSRNLSVLDASAANAKSVVVLLDSQVLVGMLWAKDSRTEISGIMHVPYSEAGAVAKSALSFVNPVSFDLGPAN
ncbi:hypothetical protein F2Q69_00016221 [Brassica cretica]|uniref:Uncharacterized protein n=1 Tax=Brassica cretica TaxID=69181 RepID=A0A8S9QM15_BRACR|nr:hypothetical protein F2Q69_00016221 [Brassica cretica]